MNKKDNKRLDISTSKQQNIPSDNNQTSLPHQKETNFSYGFLSLFGKKFRIASDLAKEDIIDKSELQAPVVRAAEFIISALIWIAFLFMIVTTICAWVFGIHFADFYLLTPELTKKSTITIMLFLLKYAFVVFLVLYGWAQWNYWRYGRLERRKTRPQVPDEVICKQFKLPIGTIYAARNSKISDIYPKENKTFEIVVSKKNIVQDGVKIKVDLASPQTG